MKSFDSVSGMFEVTSRVPDFVVFRRITGPLGSVLKLVVVESRVDDFRRVRIGLLLLSE